MKLFATTVLLALGLSIAGTASAAWISVCSGDYCTHCNTDTGGCVTCNVKTGSCRLKNTGSA